MNYMDQKVQLVNAFGTRKAIKKVTSMLTNVVDEGTGASTSKGVKDHRLKEKAQHIQEEQAELTKDIMSTASRRQNLYSKETLLPNEIMGDIPYKLTFSALQDEGSYSL